LEKRGRGRFADGRMRNHVANLWGRNLARTNEMRVRFFVAVLLRMTAVDAGKFLKIKTLAA
jgi:hypothetical protein